MRAVPFLLLLLPVAAFASSLEPVVDCAPVANAQPICGFQNPEDLARIPGSQMLLVSEYGAMEGGRAGRLALLRIEGQRREVLWAGGQGTAEARPGWGDPACPGPPDASFSPHGIDLSVRLGGELQLLVVQHGGRESVEFFEVLVGGASGPRVVWRGCAVAPEGAWLNDVVALPEGGFLVTHMADKEDTREVAALDLASASGAVYEWQGERGYRRIIVNQAVPNGIEVSQDGRKIFLNSSGGQGVTRIDRSTVQLEARAELPPLDNSTWAPDGRLLVAALESTKIEDFEVCQALERGACPLGFAIIAVDPVSMESETLYRNEGPPMGAGTVGLQVGRQLFIGSFAGDRILRVNLDAAPAKP